MILSPRGKLAIACGFVVCVTVALWFSLKDIIVEGLKHGRFSAHLNPVDSVSTEICSTHSPCQPPPPCPEPFIPERMSQSMFPASVGETKSSSPWIAENNKQLRALFECLENRNCGQNQAKLVILGSYHFRGARLGWTEGEDVWARSVILALHNLGFTYLITQNLQRTIQLYQMFPHLVKAIFLQKEDVYECFEDREHCVLSDINPDGIPIWKTWSFEFWADVAHPLGHKWTLNPEDYTLEHPDWQRNTYIGYSIEESCRARRFIPTNEREKRAYVMTKLVRNFAPGPDTAWPVDFYETAAREMGIEFVTGATEETGGKQEVPVGLVNLGQMDQANFMHHLAYSQVLIGIGRPQVSPTPYEALCLGVPFINPILKWDPENPSDKSKWASQHGLLALLEPPYVYNVRKDDREGFIQAIKDATSTPISSYVLPRMRIYSVGFRLDTLIHSNWQREAAAVLERRKNGEEEGPLFMV